MVHKLTQKVRPVASDPGLVLVTTMYLPDEEVGALDVLPGDQLRKTRHHVELDGRLVAVDAFHGPLAGLVLAEVELADGEARLALPAFAERDVTGDDRFSGGSLARLDADAARALRASLAG